LTNFRKKKENVCCTKRLPADFEDNRASYSFGNVGFSPRGRKAEELISFVWLARRQYPKAGRP